MEKWIQWSIIRGDCDGDCDGSDRDSGGDGDKRALHLI